MRKAAFASGVLGALALGCSAAPQDSPVGTESSALSGPTCGGYDADNFWDAMGKAAYTDAVFQMDGTEGWGGTVVEDWVNFMYAYCGYPPHIITYTVNYPNGASTYRFGITMDACNGNNNELPRLYNEGYLWQYPWAHGNSLAEVVGAMNWVYPFLMLQQYHYTLCGGVGTYMAIDCDPIKRNV